MRYTVHATMARELACVSKHLDGLPPLRVLWSYIVCPVLVMLAYFGAFMCVAYSAGVVYTSAESLLPQFPTGYWCVAGANPALLTFVGLVGGLSAFSFTSSAHDSRGKSNAVFRVASCPWIVSILMAV